MTKKGVAAALVVAVTITAVAALQYHNLQGLKQANGCLVIYQDQLSDGAQLMDFAIEKRKLIVEYESTQGAGKITCETTKEGLLDDVATPNQKINALWGE